MSIFNRHSNVLADYRDFARSFFSVADDRGVPIDQLNELECVEGEVYANVWKTQTIVRIDPASGKVTADIDASGLLSAIPGILGFPLSRLWPPVCASRLEEVPAERMTMPTAPSESAVKAPCDRAATARP